MQGHSGLGRHCPLTVMSALEGHVTLAMQNVRRFAQVSQWPSRADRIRPGWGSGNTFSSVPKYLTLGHSQLGRLELTFKLYRWKGGAT